MEKADILEMTVRHLKAVQRHTGVLPLEATSPITSGAGVELLGKYRAGYHECANEVSRYLGSVQGVGADVQLRLLQHLSHRIHEPATPVSPPSAAAAAALTQTQLPSLTTAFQATPTATPIAALPGGQLSINTAYPPTRQLAPSSCSPVMATSPGLPLGGATSSSSPTPVIAVVSPAALTQDTVLRNAIPLYVTPTSINIPTDCKPVNLKAHRTTCDSATVAAHSKICAKPAEGTLGTRPSERTFGARPSEWTIGTRPSERTIGARSPQLGDDVPEIFQKRKAASPVSSVTAVTSLAPTSKSPVGMYAHARLPKTELCTAHTVTDYSSKNVWRPW